MQNKEYDIDKSLSIKDAIYRPYPSILRINQITFIKKVYVFNVKKLKY
jgi:hypothetical protein